MDNSSINGWIVCSAIMAYQSVVLCVLTCHTKVETFGGQYSVYYIIFSDATVNIEKPQILDMLLFVSTGERCTGQQQDIEYWCSL